MRVGAVPEDLAAMSPGPVLAALLDSLEPRQVPNDRVVDVLRAWHRQLAHVQAGALVAMVEVARSTPFSDPDDPFLRSLFGAQREGAVQKWASEEIAAALTLTPVGADRELAFADAVVSRLPLVLHALAAGMIDRARAWVFAELLDTTVDSELLPEHVRTICGALVPLAPGWTTRRLRRRILAMLHDLDPAHARRRYRRAVRDRAVVGYLGRDGTVTITASGLPADEAAVACERLDRLAEKVQRAGHPGRLAQIQADLFLGLLDGSLHHLSETDIIARLLNRVRDEDVEPTGSAVERDDARPTTRRDEPPRAGVEIRVGLLTLIGRADRGAEIPGLGPVLPDVARRLVTAQHHGAEWRFAITDDDGLLLLAGTTRRRPDLPAALRGRSSGGIVEIHLTEADLHVLSTNPELCGPWAAVVTDLGGQYADRDDALARLDRGPRSRFARAALARHVQVRDRTCCAPGCDRPARRSDLDHTRDHSGGGGTVVANIEPLCDRHHRMKTEGGWQLAQPEPGRFRWTSPLGQVHRTRGAPIGAPTAPPAPRPPESDPDPSSTRWIDRPIFPRCDRRGTPPRRSSTASGDGEDADDPAPS